MFTQDLLEKQRSLLKAKKPAVNVKPVISVEKPLPPALIDPTEVGCIILAGGMGSRLGHFGPKGTLKLSSYNNQSLFEILHAKTKGMRVAVMTSPLNDQETKLALHGYGWECFQQKTLPFLSLDGHWLRDENQAILTGPDGNGRVFESFESSGLLDEWEKLGIKYLNLIPIDNPKAEPLNLAQLNWLQQAKCELVVTAIQRNSTNEKIGLLAQSDDRLSVVEYDEGSMEGPYGYAGLFSCTLKFAKKTAKKSLPLHVVQKKVNNKNVWKYEYFIFDLFPFAQSYKIVFQERERCFAPIKQKEDLL